MEQTAIAQNDAADTWAEDATNAGRNTETKGGGEEQK